MVGHGASQEYQPQSWMHGSQVYMSRTKTEVSVETMSDGAHWEYFAGYKSNGNTPVWKDDVADAAPLFTWENRTGVVTMTYMPAIKKYIMIVSTCTWANGSKSTVGPFDTYFLESDAITGPFTMVSYLAQFGPEACEFPIVSSRSWLAAHNQALICPLSSDDLAVRCLSLCLPSRLREHPELDA
jgi:hypothetical protein